jgi:hypothetical protein
MATATGSPERWAEMQAIGAKIATARKTQRATEKGLQREFPTALITETFRHHTTRDTWRVKLDDRWFEDESLWAVRLDMRLHTGMTLSQALD